MRLNHFSEISEDLQTNILNVQGVKFVEELDGAKDAVGISLS